MSDLLLILWCLLGVFSSLWIVSKSDNGSGIDPFALAAFSIVSPFIALFMLIFERSQRKKP